MSKGRRRGSRKGGKAAGSELFARCASGFERALADELRELGMSRVRPLQGGVAFFGELGDAYRACLWSRLATRVQLVLARVAAANADELYEGTRGIVWEQIVREGATVAVRAHGTNEALRNTQFTALKVKDALCDRLRARRGTRPDVNAADPDFEVDVSVHARRATLYLNLSGPSLHRRGYREDGVQTEAPLKETLAAGVLRLAGWQDIARAGGVLADPMCGSGTFAIEAAMAAAGIAPGMLRQRWGFAGWLGHDEALWEHVVSEARQQAELAAAGVVAIAGDIDPRAVEVARANARRAGVSEFIRFYVDDATRVGLHLANDAAGLPARGLLAVNPPYGVRLLSQQELPQVRSALAAAFEALPEGWNAAVITPDAGIDTALGLAPVDVVDCYNGPLRVAVRLYRLDAAHRRTVEVISLAGVRREVGVAERTSDQFAARLRKSAKERLRWARRAGVSCLRAYDADLPDYPLAVDLYEAKGPDGTHRYLRIDAAGGERGARVERAARRMADACALAPAVLDAGENHVVLPAGSERLGSETDLSVTEGALELRVDLTDPYDTGLPLVQRGLRELVAKRSEGVRFANLFAYSGAATASAVAGGARSSVTVDPFADRLGRVRRFLADNDLAGSTHTFVRSDARTWLERERRAGHRYDLVLCAPPAYIPATKGTAEWDRDRDWMALVPAAMRMLARGGSLLLFLEGMDPGQATCALRERGLAVEDATEQVLPHDFERRRGQLFCAFVRQGCERQR